MSWASDWLDSHAIDRELAREILGWQDDCLLFYYEGPDGESYARRRTSQGQMMQPKGMPLSCYWPLGQAEGEWWTLLCEGEGDTLAAASVLNRTNHDALNGLQPVGLPGTGAWKRAVEELADANTTRCYICLDADEAGRAATAKLIPALHEAGIEACPIELPEGKDLSDCLAGALQCKVWSDVSDHSPSPSDWQQTATSDEREHYLATLVAEADPARSELAMRLTR